MKPPFSRPVTVAALPARGLGLDIEADAAEREQVARFLGIPAVRSLVGHYVVTPWGEGGASVAGSVDAEVTQTCVITLEPVDETVHERVHLRFSPENPTTGPEIDLDLEAEEPPDPLIDGVVDLGAVAVEYLALGLDPNPRKPGAVFDPTAAGVSDLRERPFAGLADWKPKGGTSS